MENGFVSKLLAIRQAAQIGCSGAHQNTNGEWIPCSSIKQYLAITEPQRVKSRTSIVEMERRSSRRKKKGKKKRRRWESLRERGIGGITSTPGVGLSSWNGKPGTNVTTIGGGRIPGIFNGNPNPPNVSGGLSTKSLEEKAVQYSPRDNDTDVFVDIESARRRARQIGCIGVSRRISKSGKIVWMPCTNMTDYNNRTGMTALGRLNQDKNNRRVIRTVLSQELKKRKKSLVEEIMGKAIGPKISGVSRFAARTITQRFDPNAEDGDGDGLLQDGTAFERPSIPGNINMSRDSDATGFAARSPAKIERDKKIIETYKETDLTIAEIAKQNDLSLDVVTGILRSARKRGEISGKRTGGPGVRGTQREETIKRNKRIVDAYLNTDMTIAEIAKQEGLSLDIVTGTLRNARNRGEISDKRPGGRKTNKQEVSQSSIDSVGKWFNDTPSSVRQELLGEQIENYSVRSRSTRGFASNLKPIKGEDFGIEGLDNPDASSTNPFRNMGGKKMGEIIRGLVKPSSKNKKQRTTYLIGGTTGGGKTTVLDEHLVPKGIVPGRDESAHVDPDFIKMGIPGYNDGAGAPMVHDESLRAAQYTMDDARKEGADVVATGAGSTRQRAIIAQARKNGDRVVAHWVHVSQQEASKRLKQREKEKGRRIPDQTDHFARSIPRMVSSAVSNGEVDEFYIWDNEVEPGKPPRLLASFKDGKLEVFDQKKLDEFMNGNPLNPKPGDKSVLSDEAQEALDESDKFMAGGFASSGKKKGGGRYTPPKNKPGTGTQSSTPILGQTAGAGRKTSFKNDELIQKKVESLLQDMVKKVKDRMTLDKDGNPKNPLDYLAKKVVSLSMATSYKGSDSDGNNLELSDLSLAGKFNIPEDIDAILDTYLPLKDPNESFEDYAGRIMSSIPAMRFTAAGQMQNGTKLFSDAIQRAGYSEELQEYVRDVVKKELTDNPAFAEFVKEFGLPFIMGAPNDLMGRNLDSEGTSAFHNPGLGVIMMNESLLRMGRAESIGSTIDNRKYNSDAEVLRHEWFHYLDAITMASDPQALAKRKSDYAAGMMELFKDPEKVIRKVVGNKTQLMKKVEEETVRLLRREFMKQGLDAQEAKVKALDWVTQTIQNPIARKNFIDNILPEIMEAGIFSGLLESLFADRGGIYDDIAKRYTEYSRYGMHELLAEVGRIVTSTVEERKKIGSDVPSIDSSTIDFLEKFVPSVPRSKWISIIKMAYPGIKIK